MVARPCAERDKLDRRRSATLTIPPSSDARPLVYHSNHQALSTAQFRRAGLLATADTCSLSYFTLFKMLFRALTTYVRPLLEYN